MTMNRSPTLRMSVSPDDHSHLIGKKGQSHKFLQASTEMLIHFPERVRPATQSLSWEGEDEVILAPANVSVKTNPWAAEGKLEQQFAKCRERIRNNQLLINRLFVPSSTLSPEKVQQMCSLSHLAFKKGISVSNQQQCDYTIISVRGTMSQSAAVLQVTNEVQKMFPGAVYNTLRLPNVHWRDLVLSASFQVIKDFNLPTSTTPEDAFANFLCTIEVMLQFHNDDHLISIYGQDATRVLEVKQRLIQALPLGLVMPYVTSLSRNVEDGQLLASVQSLYGVRIRSCLNGRIVLETQEANFTALFEARWLLSLEDPTGLLARWLRMRNLWPTDCSLPASLSSPRAFAQLEESAAQGYDGSLSLSNFDSDISSIGLAFAGFSPAVSSIEDLTGLTGLLLGEKSNLDNSVMPLGL